MFGFSCSMIQRSPDSARSRSFLRPGAEWFFGMVVDLDQGIRGYITSAQPGHIAEYLGMRILVAQGRPNFLGENAAGTKRDIPVNDRNFGSGFQMTANEIRRKGPKQFEFEQSHLFAPGSEIRQHLPAGAGHGTGGYQDNIGIFAINGFDRAVGCDQIWFQILFLSVPGGVRLPPWRAGCCSAFPCRLRVSPTG